MQISSSKPDATLNSSLAIDAQAVGSLRGKLAKDPTGTAHTVAKQFEKMFLDMVLKSMRDATPKFDGLESNTVDTFRSMYDEQLTQTLTSGKGLGLADVIAKQIEHMNNPQSYQTPIHRPQSPVPQANASVGAKAADGQPPEVGEKQQAFLSTVGQAAASAAETLGLSPQLVLAHAALESGWGRKPLVDGKGKDTHNLFGIKAGSDWTGKTADVVTTEFVGGVAQKRVETFRAYDNYTEAFSDYAQLVAKRFGGATQSGGNAKSFATALQQGGYATDPNYADKLMHVAQSPALRAYHAA